MAEEDSLPVTTAHDDYQDSLSLAEMQLKADLACPVLRDLSAKSRQRLLSLAIEDRRKVVDNERLALHRCSLPDAEFLIEECSATIVNGGPNCAWCVAFHCGDVIRVATYIEYLVGKRPLKHRRDEQESFNLDILRLSFVEHLLHELPDWLLNKADLIFSSGISPNDEVNGSSLLEWVVCSPSRYTNYNWVKYLLDRGATPCACTDRDRGALRLAAVFASSEIYELLLRHPTVSSLCRDEAATLRSAYELIQMAASPRVLDIQAVKSHCREEIFQASATQATLCRPEANERLTLILNAAQFVKKTFGGYMPSFFAWDLVHTSLSSLSELEGTTSDIVDLLIFVVDSLDEVISETWLTTLEDAILKCPNTVDLEHLSQLLVKFCDRQLRSGGTIECPSKWPESMSILLRCALENSPSITDAINRLKSSLHRTVVFTVAFHLWNVKEEREETPRLEELMRQLLDRGTFVGLSEVVFSDYSSGQSQMAIEEGPQILSEVNDALCCQLDSEGANELFERRTRPLICLAARKLNRCLKSDEFCELPSVDVCVRKATIPLPYLVLAHSDGRPRNVLQKRREKEASVCRCSANIFRSPMGRPWEYFVRQARDF